MQKVSFDPLRPDEAIKYIKSKKLELTYDYDEMMFEAHHKAFTVAKITKLDLLKDMHEAVGEAIEKGLPFETFKKNIKPTLQKKGWWGMQEITNPKTGEVKEVYIGSRRLKNILHTNRQVAYAQGRFKQQAGFMNALYLQYHSLLHGNRRDQHKSMHGIIKHRDDVWWDINYPPNGWGCKCFTTAHTKKELDKKGLKVNTDKLQNIAHKDWAYHVGKTSNVEELYKKRASPKDFKKYEKTLQQRVATYKAIKSLFEEKPKKSVVLCESDIFGTQKPILLSHDTVRSHLHRKDISAFHYSLVPQMLSGKKKVFIQKENTYVIINKLGSAYMLALKNIANKDEIFIVSLINISSNIARELKRLSKFKEVEE